MNRFQSSRAFRFAGAAPAAVLLSMALAVLAAVCFRRRRNTPQERNGEKAGASGKAPDTALPRVSAAGDAPQPDDPSLERKAGDSKMQKLTVEAKADRLEEVTAFVDAFLETLDCPMKAQMQIDLCVEEIFVNIANYAYPAGGGTAEIQISAADGAVTLVFTDAGLPYDPLKKADPDITLAAEDRQIGGLGIFLVKKNMDTVSYRYESGKNVLTITKAI